MKNLFFATFYITLDGTQVFSSKVKSYNEIEEALNSKGIDTKNLHNPTRPESKLVISALWSLAPRS